MLYDIYYHMPAVGVLFTMRPLPQLVIELEADAVLVIAHDVDDHVLRNKLSTAFGLGVGINSSVSLLYYIPCNETTRIYLGADIRFSFLFIPARQRQEWYADDPGTPGDDTGTVYTNIIHNISYLSLSGGLTAGVSYAF